MTDRNERRGELRTDQRDPDAEREPQEDARPNNAQSEDNRSRDKNRDGSDSNPS
jgi:hypothetical protein